MNHVAIVLPPKEGFSPDAVGAIGLVVHRLAATAGGCVVGRPVREPFAGVAFHPAQPGFGLSATARYAAGVLRVLRSLQPDLVEVHNRPEIARLLARHMPRVVLILHNDPRGMRGARRPAERAALALRLAGVVAVSGYLRERFGTQGGAVQILANPIEVPATVAAERDKLIVFVGRVVADKGADAFVAACAAALPGLPGWRAAMVGADRFAQGSAETPFIAALRPRAAASGIAMLGYQPHGEAMAQLARAAIAVVPSRWAEPFGLAALEAMAHGAALICSDRGGLPEVAGETALYADPDVPGELAAAITALASNPARRQALAAAGRARARAFDVKQAAETLQAMRRAFLQRPAMQPTAHRARSAWQ